MLVGGHWAATENVALRLQDDDEEWRRGPMGDLDGDGIRNADDGDRDGDGMRNSDDRYPNNPNRT